MSKFWKKFEQKLKKDAFFFPMACNHLCHPGHWARIRHPGIVSSSSWWSSSPSPSLSSSFSSSWYRFIISNASLWTSSGATWKGKFQHHRWITLTAIDCLGLTQNNWDQKRCKKIGYDIWSIPPPCLSPSKLKKIFPANGFWSHVFYPMLIVAAAIFIAVILTLILVLKEQSKFRVCSQIMFCHLSAALLLIKSFLVNLTKCPEVNEASLMMRAPGANSQMYRVPSFGDDPFDNDDQVWQLGELNSLFWVGHISGSSHACVSSNDSQGRDRWSSQRSSSFADVSKLPPPPMMVTQVLSYNVQWDIVHLRINTGSRRRVLDWWPEIELQAFHRLWTR